MGGGEHWRRSRRVFALFHGRLLDRDRVEEGGSPLRDWIDTLMNEGERERKKERETLSSLYRLLRKRKQRRM